MARNSTQGSNAQDDSSQSTTTGSTSTTSSSTGRTNPLLYVAIIAVLVIIIVIAYYALSGIKGLTSGSSLSSNQILSNVSNSSLNQTQSMFINDLKKSEGISDLYVSYYSSNATEHITESTNLTVAISSNQTIDSYKMGNYNKTVNTGIQAYTNTKNGEVISENVSTLYYYNTNTTLTCFNDTIYSAGLVTNSSLYCGSGDQGLSYLEETPSTAANVSALSYLVFNTTVTYSGTKTIAGRSCDNFIISNATGANLESNYSVFNLCLDTQYGVPLLFNETDVVNGVPNSFAFTATAFSTNVSSSEFVIPPAYLDSVSQSII